MRFTSRRVVTPLVLSVLGMVMAAGAAHAAPKLVATVADDDFNVGSSPVTRMIEFNASEPITGIGLTARWTAVVADTQNGVWPWSTDMFIQTTAPDAQMFQWGPKLGGDRTIADFPLQDYSQAGFNAVPGAPGAPGAGVYQMQVHSGAPSPYVIGLRDVQWHLTTSVPDVVYEWTGSTVNDGTRPLWNRPFFIAGVSGLGPVAYEVHEFTVNVSGGYRFVSVVPTGDNFTFLYHNDFDPDQPLVNLLDYGLGNGQAPNGSPRGTSLIETMLFEGVTYYFVNSQWSATQAGQAYTNTVTGPGALSIAPPGCPADLFEDGVVGGADLAILLTTWGMCPAAPASCPADLNGDGVVNGMDLAILLTSWGPCPE